jgi:dienelactone hydrolase
VIHWPGGYAPQASAFALDMVPTNLAFLLRSGRALVWPIYKGTFERRIQPPETWSWETSLQQAKDLSRCIDYLETRKEDFDRGAIGYYGISWGAADTVRAVAVEDRIKAAVLVDGGLVAYSFERPERDLVHYLPRINIPVLMLNGRYDATYPPKEAQEPMFRLLGTDLARKTYRLSDSGHASAPSAERIQETVSWFDKYLGPVHPKGGPAVAPE